MNLGVGAASAIGAVVGLFAGSLAGKAVGGSESELVAGGIGGVALGAFTGAILTAPNTATTTTSTTSTTAGLPGFGAPTLMQPHMPHRVVPQSNNIRTEQQKVMVPRNTRTLGAPMGPKLPDFLSPWSDAQYAYYYRGLGLPQSPAGFTTQAQVNVLASQIASIVQSLTSRRIKIPSPTGFYPFGMPAILVLQRTLNLAQGNINRLAMFGARRQTQTRVA